MIDSVAFVWGHAVGTAARRADAPVRGRTVEPEGAEPVYLEMDELVDRFGSSQGEVTSKRYNEARPEYGHWKNLGPHDSIELLYGQGRLELRCSLPNLLVGRNDVVLDERGTHDALRLLADTGRELTDARLDIREAVPARLDPCYQWRVPSVAFVLEHVKSAFAPERLDRDEIVSPKGGRSLVWGYGGKRVLRFYDKGAKNLADELKDLGRRLPHGVDLNGLSELDRKRAIRAGRERAREAIVRDAELDVMLRFEIQDRRRARLRLVHERGYQAADVQHQLEHALAGISAIAFRDVEALLEARQQGGPHAVGYALGALYLFDHDELWPVMRRVVSRRAYYAWRRRARRHVIEVADWSPRLPDDAFTSGASLWSERVAA